MKPETETTCSDWSPQDELEWTAFRYVANELPAAELAEFEQRLADDQHAREAVARCVQITHSIVALEESQIAPAAPSGSAPVSASVRRHRKLWSAVGILSSAAAVCCAFWIGTQFSDRDRQRKIDSGDSKTPSQKMVVMGDPSKIIDTWLNFDLAATLDADPPLEPYPEEPPKSPTSETTVADGSFDWVVAAVAGTSPVPGDNLPLSKEPK